MAITQVQSHIPSMAVALLDIALHRICRHFLYFLLRHCPPLRPPILHLAPLLNLIDPIINSIPHLERELLIHKVDLLPYQDCLLDLHPEASHQ